MPWSANSFQSKHNKKLGKSKAGKAARIANAILRRTGDEGLAIATANARAKGQAPKHHAKPFGSFAP
jgi:uncharacterized protein YdaT